MGRTRDPGTYLAEKINKWRLPMRYVYLFAASLFIANVANAKVIHVKNHPDVLEDYNARFLSKDGDVIIFSNEIPFNAMFVDRESINDVTGLTNEEFREMIDQALHDDSVTIKIRTENQDGQQHILLTFEGSMTYGPAKSPREIIAYFQEKKAQKNSLKPLQSGGGELKDRNGQTISKKGFINGVR